MNKISNFKFQISNICERLALSVAEGFTLIEVLIVVSVISLSIPLVFGLFFINLQSQKKTYILQETKRNGDGALSIIEDMVRTHATKVVDDSGNELCATAGADSSGLDHINFTDADGNTFTFGQNLTDQDSIKIASSSSTGLNIPLTSSLVSVTSLSFGCTRPSSFSAPIVSVSFTLTQAGSPGRSENEDSLQYATQVKLRGYELSY